MRKSIVKGLAVIILASMLFSLGLNYYVQVRSTYKEILGDSQDLFWQIRQILHQNETAAENAKADFKEECLVRAKAAAYLVQYHPEMLDDQQEMKKVAKLLQVDEFHIFNAQGTLYAGSEPKYFNMNFNSGEQMQFFLPMLEDKSLELCQDITPNTAEAKLMQYAAVWREDGKEIVQIGMEPERVMEVMKTNELSYIFSLITGDENAEIYAIDEDSHEILGAMDGKTIGKNADKIGIDIERLKDNGKLYRMKIDGRESMCAFQKVDSLILVRTCDRAVLFETAGRYTILLTLYLILLSLIIIVSIIVYLNRYIIRSIFSINGNLMRIADGNLDVELPAQPTPELSELSRHVNEMVKSILDSTNKLSVVLQRIQFPIAVYEYGHGMNTVRVTSKMSDIFNLKEQDEELFQNTALFREWISGIQKNPVDADNHIFLLPGEGERYVRIESFEYEKSTLGIVMDVTQEVLEKRAIERERDVDLLTGLYNRRAFYNQAENLFAAEEVLGQAVMIMMDSDGLKVVNDGYGHENGDRYLQAIARTLSKIPVPNKILARLSGDEFALFIYGCRDREELLKYIDELKEREAHGGIDMEDGSYIAVRFSAGCAFYPEDGHDLRSLLKKADEKMYENKKRAKEERKNK